MNRIDRPRFSVRDKVLATFPPRGMNRWNARIADMFLRKERGKRRRGRAWQQGLRAYNARLRGPLTPSEIDHLARATLSRRLANRTQVASFDRWTPPILDTLRKRTP